VGWRLGEQDSAGSGALNASLSPFLVVARHSDAIATSSLSGLRCNPDKRRSDGLRLIDQRLESVEVVGFKTLHFKDFVVGTPILPKHLL
jgi:hypothetical protein